MTAILKLLLITSITFVSFGAGQQPQGATTQNGYIFFSASYDKYLGMSKHKHDFDFAIIPDFFIPVKQFNKNGDIFSNFTTDNLLKAQSIEQLLANRIKLKNQAIKFENLDTLSSCYLDIEYFLLPVKLSYRFINDEINFVPCAKPMKLLTNNKEIKFQFTARNIQITSIYLLDEYLLENIVKDSRKE